MSVSQTYTVPKLAGGLISFESITERTPPTAFRRSKIVCTIGPACWEVPQLESLIDAGMNVARLNFSHGDHPTHAATLERVRQAAKNRQRNVGIMLDTKGPEIRTGFFAHGASKVSLVKGETLVLTADYQHRGDARKIACSYPTLAKSVKAGQEILVADGSLVLTVLSCDVASGEVTARIENDATIGERKNVNLPGVDTVDLPTFTEKDVDDIVNFGIKHNVDFIAASFVRSASDVQNLRQLLSENGGQSIQIIAKIETQGGVERFDEILQETDAVMVARGDLGMEIHPAKVFLAQKMMIRESNLAGKPVITATQMLESMIHSPRPTRAEASDVANAILDGSDCVMLSGETANGPYFEQAVRVMSRVCCEAEKVRNYNAMYASIRTSVLLRYGEMSSGESLASSAVKTSIDINATVIVVLSESGQTARYIAKFRPKPVVVCLTPSPIVARQTSGIVKGVHAYIVDSLSDDVELSRQVGYECVHVGLARPGDLMVVLSGSTFGHGQNNQIRVEPVLSADETYENRKVMHHLHSFES